MNVRRALSRVVLVAAAMLLSPACTSDDGSADDTAVAHEGDSDGPSSQVETSDDPQPESSSTVTRPEDDDHDISSSATTTEGDDIRTEAEVRVREILSEYDGRETPEGTQLTVPSHVLFDFDEDILRPDARESLAEIVEVLEYYDGAPIDVVGHTDSQGPADYNQGLSERRASAVADFLDEAGIDHGRMTVDGRGETEPAASNDTDEGRQSNRRVEILIHGVAPPAEDD